MGSCRNKARRIFKCTLAPTIRIRGHRHIKRHRRTPLGRSTTRPGLLALDRTRDRRRISTRQRRRRKSTASRPSIPKFRSSPRRLFRTRHRRTNLRNSKRRTPNTCKRTDNRRSIIERRCTCQRRSGTGSRRRRLKKRSLRLRPPRSAIEPVRLRKSPCLSVSAKARVLTAGRQPQSRLLFEHTELCSEFAAPPARIGSRRLALPSSIPVVQLAATADAAIALSIFIPTFRTDEPAASLRDARSARENCSYRRVPHTPRLQHALCIIIIVIECCLLPVVPSSASAAQPSVLSSVIIVVRRSGIESLVRRPREARHHVVSRLCDCPAVPSSAGAAKRHNSGLPRFPRRVGHVRKSARGRLGAGASSSSALTYRHVLLNLPPCFSLRTPHRFHDFSLNRIRVVFARLHPCWKLV